MGGAGSGSQGEASSESAWRAGLQARGVVRLGSWGARGLVACWSGAGGCCEGRLCEPCVCPVLLRLTPRV